MKLKLSFGKGGLKGFLVQHSEKAIFGAVLLLVAIFVYSSATQEGYELDKLPEDLQQEAATARSKLDENHWDALAPERVSKVGDYPELAKVAREKIDGTGYGFVKGWNVPLMPTEAKRGDPEMLAPTDVEATGAVVAVAIRTRTPQDPFAGDDDAVVKPKEEKKRRRRRKKPRYDPYGGYGSGSEMYGEDGYGYGGEEGYGSEEGYGYGSEEGYGYGSEEGYGYGEEGYGYGSPAGGTSPTGEAPAAPRRLGQNYIQQYVKGFRTGGGGAMMSSGSGMTTSAPRGVVGKSFAVVAVKALVPYEKQWEEYERVLAEATGYSPEVDRPRYLSYIAERAEVSEDDPDAPLEWKTISWSDLSLRAARLFPGVPQEVADPAYTVPGILTMPIPPILIKDYEQFALHSEVPKLKPRVMAPERPEDGEEEDPTLIPSDEELAEGATARPQGRPGMRPGTTGYGSEYGSGYGSEYGSGYGYGSEEGYGYGSEDGYGYGSEEGYGYGSGYGEEDGSGYGEEYGSGYGSYYGTGSPMGRRPPLAKYKLVRFFDFSAQPGKSYRYRVCVRLEDPNRPQNPAAEPSRRILEQSVLDRLAKVIAEDEKRAQETGQVHRTDYIQTEWSDPSNVVTIDKPEWYAAGGATAGKTIPLSRGGPEVQIAESSGKLVAAVWDVQRATEIPVEKTVYRGSFLDFTTEADVLNPLTLQLKTVKDYDFETGACVVDLRGGEKLIVDVIDEKEKEEETHTTPGEYLVVDGEGNLLVCNEVDDVESYRRLTFVDEQAEAAASSSYGGYPSSEDGYYEEGYGEMGGYAPGMGMAPGLGGP